MQIDIKARYAGSTLHVSLIGLWGRTKILRTLNLITIQSALNCKVQSNYIEFFNVQ